MNLIQTYKRQIVSYLSRSTSESDSLIKFDTNYGYDFGFQVNLDIWKNYIKIEGLDDFKNNILIYAVSDANIDEIKAIDKFKEKSESWIFRTERVWIERGICCINLNRCETFKRVLDLIDSGEYVKLKHNQDQSISININNMPIASITQFRLETIYRVMKNLLKFSPYIFTDDSSASQLSILLTTKSNLKADDINRDLKTIVCGVVCNQDDGNKKISQMEAEKYIEKRQNDMHLIAVHKFGVRIKKDEEFLELTKQLGRAAAIMDMIEVKYSSALRLTSNPKQAFILYNSARIETLISTFQERVIENYYPALSEVSLELLTEPLEWELLKHLLAFPDVIEKSLGDLMNGQIAIHILYKYLIGIVNTFSVYYSKKKILLENRPHLVPLVHAKIYLLKAIQKILNLTFGLLEIEPVKFM